MESNVNKKYAVKFCVALIISLCLLLSLQAVSFASDGDSDGYDDNDFYKLQTFLTQPSSTPGKTNGQQININFAPNNPSTWLGVIWNTEDPKRVISLNWSMKSLSGYLDISDFSALISVNCSINSIDSINIDQNHSLTDFNCQENDLTSLNVQSNTALNSLNCMANQISSLNLTSNAKLTKLVCTGNPLSSLDVSNNPLLEYLSCNNDGLTSLSLVNNLSLKYLYCGGTKIETLNLSNLTLSQLQCLNNQLSSISVNIQGIDISIDGAQSYIGLAYYQTNYYAYAESSQQNTHILWIESGKIIAVDSKCVLTPGRSYNLSIDYGYVVQFDSKGGSEITKVGVLCDNALVPPPEPTKPSYTFGGWFKDQECTIPWNFSTDTVTNDMVLYAKFEKPGDMNNDGYNDNDFSKLQTFLSQPSSDTNLANGKQLSINYDPQNPDTWTGVTWDTSSPKRVKYIGHYVIWANNKLSGSIDLSDMVALEEVRIVQNSISQINTTGANSLQQLVCYANLIETLDVSTNSKLILLMCSDNKLQSLDVGANQSLVELNCSNNMLDTLRVNGASSLLKLYCGNNRLVSLDISTKIPLTTIYCDANQLTSINLGGATSLETLYCNSNRMDILDLSANTMLSILHCYENNLTMLDLHTNTKLTTLACSNNQLTSLDINECPSLRVLSCASNNLTTLDTSAVSTLTDIVCYSNKLTQIHSIIAGIDIKITSFGGFVDLYKSNKQFFVLAETHPNGIFLGWNQNNELITYEQLLNLNLGYSYNLVANFGRTITFDYQNQTNPTNIQALFDTTISEPNKPEKEGYTFEGWYREADCINIWRFAIDTVVENTTLYAKWLINKYLISFDSQGGSKVSDIEANYKLRIADPEEPTRLGYNFAGWYKEPACLNKWDFIVDTVPARNITLYAKWLIKTTIISFDSQGGSNVADIESDYGTLIAAPAAPTRTGFTFAGWYKEATCTNAWVFSTDTIPEHDITLYAKWTLNQYTVSFDSQGGNTIPEIEVEYDSIIIEPIAPTKTGYTFAGWYKEAAYTNEWIFDSDTIPAYDITLYAKWKINTYTVTFDSQGGSTVAPMTVEYDNTITAPAPPARTGYTFQGWYKESSCTTAWDFDNDTVTADITLYAKWVTTTPIGVSAASASYSSVKVSWTAVPGATGYQVYRATSSTGAYALAGTVTSSSFTNTGLTAGTTYYYKVRSYAGATKVYSAFSSVVSVKPVPAAPTSPKATPVTYNSIKVTWSAVTGASGYVVYRATGSTGTYASVGTATSTSFTNTSIGTGITYYYKVRAYRVVGSTKVYGSYSAAAYTRAGIGYPTTIGAARASSSSIKVTWSAVSGATRYELWRSTSSGGTYTLVAVTASLYYTNGSLTTGRTYYYKVRAYHLEGTTKVYGSWSKVVYAKP